MKFKRTRYAFGALERKSRKRGPDVWVYRFRQIQPDGTVRHKSKMVGTVEQYPTESQAWKAAEVFRLSANPDNPAQHGVSWGALIDRYISTDLPRRNSTSHNYRWILDSYIKPKWGEYALGNVTPFAFEAWLNSTTTSEHKPTSRKTRRHIRSLMHILYGCAMRWGFVPIAANPFGQRMIRINNAGLPPKKRLSLTVEQFRRLLRHPKVASQPYRTMVLLAGCTGLRSSEMFALKWSDVDWENGALHVRRSFVGNTFDMPKTISSHATVPIAAQVTDALLKWKQRSRFKRPDDLVFASPFRGGKLPYDPSGVRKDHLTQAGVDIGFGIVSGVKVDSLGWHSLRHSYRTWLDATGAPLTVQQRLMRHAAPMMTLMYGDALESSKRDANSKVVDLIAPIESNNGQKRAKGTAA